MNGSGLRSRLARLEARLHPRKPREIIVWSEGEPRPDVPPGVVLIHLVTDDDGGDGQGNGDAAGVYTS